MNAAAAMRRALDGRATRWLAAGAAAGVAALILRLWTPGDGIEGATCAMRRMFGLPCPTCGMTRAFAALAKGDFAHAVALHPLSPLLAAELAAAWVMWGVSLGARGWPLGRRATFGALVGTGALLAVVWVARLATGTLPG